MDLEGEGRGSVRKGECENGRIPVGLALRSPKGEVGSPVVAKPLGFGITDPKPSEVGRHGSVMT